LGDNDWIRAEHSGRGYEGESMRWNVAILAGWIVLAAAAPGEALTPYLVKEINTNSVPASSSPQGFFSLDSYAVFLADDGIDGPEPWSTDGTAAGTHRLSRCVDCLGLFGPFGVVGDLFLFIADAQGAPGQAALWATRGTVASTKQLMVLVNAIGDCSGSTISWSSEAQGLVYFSYTTDSGGCQLWRSDGTKAGTYELADFSSPDATFPQGLNSYAGEMYFGANDGTGPALWKTDGTPRGTEVVVRFAGTAAAGDFGPEVLNVAGSELVFTMNTAARGYELWRSNGTARGTQPLPELVRGLGSPIFYDFLPAGPELLFVADDGDGQNLWSTNGGSSSARQLTHFKSPSGFGPDFLFPRLLLGRTAFFGADDGVHGLELWASDGTPAVTHMVSDVCPGTCSSSAFPQAILGDRLLFSADDGVHGTELWTTDGTASGTHLVADICPGSCDSSVEVLDVVGSRAVLVAIDGVHGTQLWGTDGTAVGTRRLTSFPEPNPLETSDAVVLGFTAGGLVFQGADPTHGNELWRSDGTRAGTHLLKDIDPGQIVDGSFPTDLQGAGDRVLFAATDGGADGEQLWVSDGTAGGTAAITSPANGLAAGADAPDSLAAVGVGETLFFIAPDPTSRAAVSRSDGTLGGTLRLTPAGAIAGLEIAAVGGTLFFSADDGVHGPALWKSDGTPAGTVPVDGVNWTGGGAHQLTPWNGQLFYLLDSGSGDQLWRSDGTAVGTAQVADLNFEFEGGRPPVLTPFGGRLYFFARASSDDIEAPRLWSTDGTAAGTKQALSFGLSPDSELAVGYLAVAGNQLFVFVGSGLWVGDGTDAGTRLVSASASITIDAEVPSPAAVLGNRLAFITGDASPGLWISDGTAAGTIALKPGTQDGSIFDLDQVVAVAGQLFFSSSGALWQSDGTPAGTTLLLSGLAGNLGQELAVAGQRVFFQNNDPVTGNQLWAVQP
jgi:ELWxxDGT repeat protein